MKQYKCTYKVGGEKRNGTVEANNKKEAKEQLKALWNASDIVIGDPIKKTTENSVEEQKDV